MSKVRWETKRALREVARLLGVPQQNVCCQGLKDKHGYTSQLISVRGPFREGFWHKDIALEQLYGQWDDLQRGKNWGNQFTINIRSDATATDLNLEAVEEFLNVFGSQRLGEPGSHEIGRLLLEGQFDEAVRMLLDGRMSAKDLIEARKASGGSWVDALLHSSYRHYFRFEVGKWQSYLWNQLAQEELAAGKVAGQDQRLPMWQPDAAVVERYRHLWNPPDKLHPEAMQELDRQRRPVLARAENFQAKHRNGVWRLSFALRPSVYATVALSQLFQLEEKHEHR